jgi:DNA polymerase
MTILLDFESRSRADLKRVGGRNYWADESTEALCCVLHDTDTGERGLWLPGDPCPVSRGDVLGAHNATGFDRFAWARVWGLPSDGPYVDTSEEARKAGLPGALDALGTRWLGLEKDKASSRFTANLSSVRRPREIPADVWRELDAASKRRRGKQPDVDGEAMDRVVAYCESDVEIIAHGWEHLAPWLDVDAETQAVDRVVNDRGVGFDSQLARALLAADERNMNEALDVAARVCGIPAEQVAEIAGSPSQFAEYCGVENAQAETVDRILKQDPAHACPSGAHAMATARRALASIARGKLEAGLARVSPDGRLRDTLKYYGAHTGRWSHKGMQLGNMKRPAGRFETWTDADICRRVDEILAGASCAQDEIDLHVRSCLVARPGHALAVCDFSGVEARALAWAAGDFGALDVFASGVSPYKVMAALIFGTTPDAISKGHEWYTVGKIAELACGYGMGARKFHENNADALERAGVDAADVVRAWRELHAPIVRFWYALEAGFRAAVQGRRAEVSCFAFEPANDGAVALILPSGRPIMYERAHARQTPGRYGKPRWDLSYQGSKPHREHVYGGLITENAIQAMCRDLLADALVRCEAAGLDPVLHVHDEIVAEVPASCAAEGYEYLHEIMTTLPAWAEGFPIGAAGHFGRRYRK